MRAHSTTTRTSSARRGWTAVAVFIVTITIALSGCDARADGPEPAKTTANAPMSDDVQRARAAFKEGAAFVEQSEWASALAAFERSASFHEYVLTTYNVGVCQRFLGRYTLAASTFRRALAKQRETNEMAKLFVDQTETYLQEIEKKLVRATITISPPTASTAIDGRPLATADGRPELVAGLAASGEGKSVEKEKFVVLVDPGSHVFTFQLAGHDTIEMRRDLKPGANEDVAVSLTEQPGELAVAADRAQAIVRVNDVDVGIAPVAVSRPPGSYRVTVSKAGFDTYSSSVTLRPGQKIRLSADLPVEKIPLTKRWWFWTAAVGVLAGGAVATYALTRPAPEPPPYQSGSTGWLLEAR